MLSQWVEIDIADALELLSSYFKHQQIRNFAVNQLKKANILQLESYLLQLVQALRYETSYPSALSTFLIEECCKQLRLCIYFFWYLKVESNTNEMYHSILKDFCIYLYKIHPEWSNELKKQEELRKQLLSLANDANKGGGKVHVKQANEIIIKNEYKHLRSFQSAVVLPNKPEISINGLYSEHSIMFKSALAPILCAFNIADTNTSLVENNKPNIYRIIWKTGDDLRQDQLIMQMINLMDNILKS